MFLFLLGICRFLLISIWVRIGFELFSDWVRIGFGVFWFGFGLGSNWVRIGFELGSGGFCILFVVFGAFRFDFGVLQSFACFFRFFYMPDPRTFIHFAKKQCFLIFSLETVENALGFIEKKNANRFLLENH